jgi:hypothetical protein
MNSIWRINAESRINLELTTEVRDLLLEKNNLQLVEFLAVGGGRDSRAHYCLFKTK